VDASTSNALHRSLERLRGTLEPRLVPLVVTAMTKPMKTAEYICRSVLEPRATAARGKRHAFSSEWISCTAYTDAYKLYTAVYTAEYISCTAYPLHTRFTNIFDAVPSSRMRAASEWLHRPARSGDLGEDDGFEHYALSFDYYTHFTSPIRCAG
jgi:hypothetical protein